MKKKLLLILLMIFVIAFTACNEEELPEVVPDSSEVETEAEDKALTLVADGEAQYAILLPVESTGPMREAVNSFADKLSDLYGVKFDVKKNKNLAGGKRILMVGVPEDDAYTEYFAEVPYGEYAVKIADDGNIVVAAWSLDAINTACTKLLFKLQSAYDKGDLSGAVCDDLLLNGKAYAPLQVLERCYREAIAPADVVGLAIGTRPDCLSPEVVALLAQINAVKPVSVELGLQTLSVSS